MSAESVRMTSLERAIELYAANQGPISAVYQEFLAASVLLITSEDSPNPVQFRIDGQEKGQVWVCTRKENVPDFAPGVVRVLGYQILPVLMEKNVHIVTGEDVHDLMLIGEKALACSAPEITEQLRSEARNHPGTWFSVPDVVFREESRGKLQEQAFVGQYWVTEEGEITSRYRPNPAYLPSPVALGYPQPESLLEKVLHPHSTGYVSDESLVSVVSKSEFALVVDEEGVAPVFPRGERSTAVAASAVKHIPDSTKDARTATVQAMKPIFHEADLLFDIGTRHQTRIEGSLLLAELERQESAEQAAESSEQPPEDPEQPTQEATSQPPPPARGGAGAEPGSSEQPQAQSQPAPQSQPQSVAPLDAHERFLGSVLAGALGDALGYAIELDDIGMIRERHGEAGLTGPVLQDGLAKISDDTQMMLFTLEGLIRAHVARRMRPVDNDPVPEVQHAYQRWFHTQYQPWPQAAGPYAQHLARPDGWLITVPELFSARSPGSTCMSALANFARTHRQATPQARINDSKGCGGVMRAAPVAVWSNDPAEVFHAAVGTAALTHSHPSGHLSAGVLAVVVHQLLREVPLSGSVRIARELLLRSPGHEEQLRSLDAAVELAGSGPVSPEELNGALGQGRVGEEALAIGLYAAMAAGNLREALLLSVNHSGDSDSTGIVCGNIAGAMHGTRAVPADWLSVLELHGVIRTLAQDALAEFSPGPPTDAVWTQRYPAW